jgi:AraC-like DNA-binding protein
VEVWRESMLLKLNIDKLKELMRDFYILTQIKIVLFDDAYNEILAYPESHSEFCSIMHNQPDLKVHCLKSNAKSFEECKRTRKLTVYKCHAGLVEATAPLKDNNIIIGYIMFGQITDVKDKQKVFQNIIKACEKYNMDASSLIGVISAIKYKSSDQIHAAAKILEACTYYLILNELISIQQERFIQKLDIYIEKNIDKDISITNLSEEFKLSRTKLYDMTNKYLGIGIAEYIKSKRIHRAKQLLLTTDKSVTEISHMSGFLDYNYFCRVFKKEVGIPARKYRER